MWGVFFVWLLLTFAVYCVASCIFKHMESPEYQAWKKRRDAECQKALMQTEKNAAREHLLSFYEENRPYLERISPPHLLEAFVRTMADKSDPEKLWAICEKKIAQLQPLVMQERERHRKEDQHQAKKALRLQTIDKEIAGCRQNIERLKHSGLEQETIEDETHAQLQLIRKLEEERTVLLALNEEGAS